MGATVAVVGRGFGAAVHAPGWELAGAQVLGVAGREGWRELVERADVVSVAAPPAAHREVVLEAIRVGARVLCEKPLATTTADAELLEDAGRATAERRQLRLPRTTRIRALPRAARRGRAARALDGAVAAPTGTARLEGRPAPGRRAVGIRRARARLRALAARRCQVEEANVAAERGRVQRRARARGWASHASHRLARRTRAHPPDRVGRSRAREPHATDPVGAFTLTDSGRAVDVLGAATGPSGGDPRVAPFAALALALLEDRERPTFTDGLQAQRLMDAARKLGSSS